VAQVAPDKPEKPVDLGLRVEALTRKGQGFIDSDEPLRSGDRLALHITVSEPAYVYVGYSSTGKAGSLLFPKSAPERIAPGVGFRYPPPGQWLELDKKFGQEDIFVYAAKRMLTNEETMALLKEDSAKVQRVSKATLSPKKKKVAKQPAQPGDDSPEALSASTRGLQVVGEGGAEVQAENGVTKAHFLIRHEK
jgi:hypothetical protein